MSIRLDELPQHHVDEKQLLLLMKDWRRGRATRNMRQALSDAYVAIFALVMVAAMLFSAIAKAQNQASGCGTGACTAARSLLPWAAMAGAFGLTLTACRLFGPVLASAAEGFWLMDSPISRARVLIKRLWMAVGAAFVGGAAIGALVAALTGSVGQGVLAWALGAGLGASGLTAFAAAEQGAERTWIVRLVQAVVSIVGVGVLVLVVGTAARWFSLARVQDASGSGLAFAVGGFGVVLALGAGLIARSRLDRIRRNRLTSGGALVSGMQGAMFALDFGLMRDILVEREAQQRGFVRATRGVGLGVKALVMRDVQRLWRFPKPLILLAVSVVVPYAVMALGLRSLAPSVSALVLMVAMVPFFSTLRVLSRTRGFARCLPFSTSEIRTAASVVPAGLGLVWAIAAAPAFIGYGSGQAHRVAFDGAMISVATAMAGLVAAIRWVSAKPADYSAPMVATGFGAMPPGLIFNLIRGFDMLAIITFPLMFGWPTWLSIGIAVLAFVILRSGGIDQQSLLEQQEEQKRLLEEAKQHRPGGGANKGGGPNKNGSEKIRIQRGR